ERGGQFEAVAVSRLSQDDGEAVLETNQGQRRADFAVVAAGAYSHHLSKTLNEPVPLETERGYNTTLPAGAFDLRLHLTFAGHGFVVTGNKGGVRVGGAVELGGLNRPPDYRRSDILLEKAARFMPGLDTGNGERWMGFRPSLPDSLPILDRSAKAQRVFYAFGHGHTGLTQAAGTAELIADVLTQQAPAIDLTPYRLNRFR
ncbi:FAD-binding oxidoreductase, partial [Alphaproteobacteria bacterium]|nr:FAD-binding oxidoreductase [Alphaproteobacteria bacterium]